MQSDLASDLNGTVRTTSPSDSGRPSAQPWAAKLSLRASSFGAASKPTAAAAKRAQSNGSLEDERPSTAVPDGDGSSAINCCGSCRRQMTETALDRMEKMHGSRVCPKCAPKKPRRTFDSQAMRRVAVQQTAEPWVEMDV